QSLDLCLNVFNIKGDVMYSLGFFLQKLCNRAVGSSSLEKLDLGFADLEERSFDGLSINDFRLEMGFSQQLSKELVGLFKICDCYSDMFDFPHPFILYLCS